jgi:hypothetical protein
MRHHPTTGTTPENYHEEARSLSKTSGRKHWALYVGRIALVRRELSFLLRIRTIIKGALMPLSQAVQRFISACEVIHAFLARGGTLTTDEREVVEMSAVELVERIRLPELQQPAD